MSGVPLYSVNSYFLPIHAQSLKKIDVLYLGARSRARHEHGEIYNRCGSSFFELLGYSWYTRPSHLMHLIFWFQFYHLKFVFAFLGSLSIFLLVDMPLTLSFLNYIIQNKKSYMVTFFLLALFFFLNQFY